jgi:hypothetical protein
VTAEYEPTDDQRALSILGCQFSAIQFDGITSRITRARPLAERCGAGSDREYEPTADQRSLVESAAASGLTQADIAPATARPMQIPGGAARTSPGLAGIALRIISNAPDPLNGTDSSKDCRQQIADHQIFVVAMGSGLEMRWPVAPRR